ncbi:mitogen-activated protein kinase kinase kinase 20 [Abeliophyllum distichum]|uniref:Mitogen-activated protein kinase kinase kinase 20 n=1 Tax=Abeliophyllum distichum TaxID=126358 RepID=A0ABD1P0Y4_9LAMI
MSCCTIDSSSFSRNCSLVSFFFEKSVTKVFHASFGVLASRMCSNISSSTVVFKANIALPALIFHFCKMPSASSASWLCNFTTTVNLPKLSKLQKFLRPILVEEKKLLDLFKECPCILHCFGDDVTTEENEELYNIELEYASGGCLADRKGLPDNIVRQHTKSILIALSHVHKLGYVHCDVKPHNVLLVADSLHSRNKGIGEIAKLADFGSAKNIKDDQDNKEFRGTVLYAAPESIIHQEYQPESDIWALGCTVLHMITGKSPWKVEKRAKAEDVLYKIGCSHELPDIPSKASKEAKDFLKKCLIKNPKERWTADMLLSHPFLASIGDSHQQHCGRQKHCFPKLFRGFSPMHQCFHVHNRVQACRVQV